MATGRPCLPCKASSKVSPVRTLPEPLDETGLGFLSAWGPGGGAVFCRQSARVQIPTSNRLSVRLGPSHLPLLIQFPHL